MIKENLFCRRCDYTGKGMNEGYVFVDDSCMIDDRKLLIKELKQDRKAILDLLPGNINDIKNYDNCCYLEETELKELSIKIQKAFNNNETDEELCDIAYAVDYYYWTEWEDEAEWIEIDGVLEEYDN